MFKHNAITSWPWLRIGIRAHGMIWWADDPDFSGLCETSFLSAAPAVWVSVALEVRR
ncbi:hypothetical protein GE21DRAFT_1026290 [Neurospora crassa]|nr:hypothetical protein GE21DRAFT_1026290 [Neurospora crassa]